MECVRYRASEQADTGLQGREYLFPPASAGFPFRFRSAKRMGLMMSAPGKARCVSSKPVLRVLLAGRNACGGRGGGGRKELFSPRRENGSRMPEARIFLPDSHVFFSLRATQGRRFWKRRRYACRLCDDQAKNREYRSWLPSVRACIMLS